MSVVGIDFGNTNCVIAIAQKGGIDVIANEVSNRLTPTMVSFGEKERYLGESALTQWMRAVKSTVTDIKKIIGRNFNEPDVQLEAKRAAYKIKEHEGKTAIDVMYANEQVTFTPEQITGMLLGQLKRTAEAAISTKVTDVVISVPGYWTDSQRRAMLDATKIAGLNCLRLFNETTATALGYGIYKTDLPEKEPIKVLFVDVGESSISVAAVAFQKGQLKVISTAYDPNLGGRDFDEVLVKHFAKEFQTKYKIDVYSNQKALLRLRVQCEKVKKILSANAEAPLNIDNLMNDIDVRSSIDRKGFEDLSQELLTRAIEPVKRVLEETGIAPDHFFAVEAVGGGSRLLSIQKKLHELLGREISRTLNSEEAVARGCALQCAMLSPIFKVREFLCPDTASYPISLTWKYVGGNGSEDSAEVFARNNPVPSPKMITFNRSEAIELTAHYSANANVPAGHPTQIGRYVINNIPPSTGTEPSKVKVKVKLDIHGIFHLESVQFVETLPDTDQPMGEAEATATPTSPPPAEEKKEGDEKKEADDKKKEADKKKQKVKRTNLPFDSQTTSHTTTGINNAIEEEGRMAAADHLAIETADRKNALESYVYSMRSRLTGDLVEYGEEADRNKLIQMLNDAENWLYGEGEDVTKSVYQGKLDELKKLGDPIAQRHREAEERPEAIKALIDSIAYWQAEVGTTSDKYEHIEQADKDKISAAIEDARNFLVSSRAKQDSLPKTASPAFLASDLVSRKNNLEKLAKPILSKPKPKPKPAPAPTPAQSTPAPAADANAAPTSSADSATPSATEEATSKTSTEQPSQMDVD